MGDCDLCRLYPNGGTGANVNPSTADVPSASVLSVPSDAERSVVEGLGQALSSAQASKQAFVIGCASEVKVGPRHR